MKAIAVQAAWVVPIASFPLRHGWLVALEGRVEFIGQDLPLRWQSVPQFKLLDRLVIPGLINSHCHLEFSDLCNPFPFEGSFIGWIGNVVRHRRDQLPSGLTPEQTSLAIGELRTSAMRQGLTEAYASGTRYVFDTITTPWSSRFIEQALSNINENQNCTSVAYQALVGETPFYYHPCPELLDTSQVRYQQTLAFAEEVHGYQTGYQSEPYRTNPQFPGMRTGEQIVDCVAGRMPAGRMPAGRVVAERMALSPHAPYTVTQPRARQIADRVQMQDGILSMHLAESLEESQWLRNGTGPIQERLAPYWDASFQEAQVALRRAVAERGWESSFTAYLQSLSASDCTLLAHGNNFSATELEFIAASREKIAIVHCPRTFRHFHPDKELRYPMAARTELGVNHFLGTDSRASNPDLSLWKEVLTVVGDGFPIEKSLNMVTAGPADFLQLNDLGSLSVGKRSLCTAIGWDGGPPPKEVLDSLFAPQSDPAAWLSSRAEPLEVSLKRIASN